MTRPSEAQPFDPGPSLNTADVDILWTFKVQSQKRHFPEPKALGTPVRWPSRRLGIGGSNHDATERLRREAGASLV